MKLTRYRGDTKPLTIVVDDETAGRPANLTGCTVKLTVDYRSNPTDASTVVIQLTGSIPVPTYGEVSFDFTDEQADNVGMYYYDIEITSGDGKRNTIVKGVFEFLQDITK